MQTRCFAALLAAALAAPLPGLAQGPGSATQAMSAGGGHYLITLASGTFEVQFGFSAIVHRNGRATGQFHHVGEVPGGPVEFHGEVTCLAVDEALGRAWIGGVITVNRSENPIYQTDAHQPGHDIWFRVLDAGDGGSGLPDRTTFVGFEMPAIPSSEAYCRDRPWRDDNIWAVTGNLTVRP